MGDFRLKKRGKHVQVPLFLSFFVFRFSLWFLSPVNVGVLRVGNESKAKGTEKKNYSNKGGEWKLDTSDPETGRQDSVHV